LQPGKIIIAVTGSIAAYKIAHLVRLFIKAGHEVRVLMTPAARDFISPLTLSTLSRHKVEYDVSDGDAWNNHVELGMWADVMLVAPATANTMAKMAHGICDNLVTAVYLSAKCPVFFAPAMDLDMWHHPTTQSNIHSLESYGNQLINSEEGELASGLHGMGRMAEPETIFEKITGFLDKKKDLLNLKVLITAGPTQENIDPVRFIGNRSTGKMGIALARACASRGGIVKLVLGPSVLNIEHSGIALTRVQTAEEMFEAAQSLHPTSDICIFTAAVADYRPAHPSEQKIKKKTEALNIELVKTTDIAATLGSRKKSGQIHVGFALETDNEDENAQGKLKKKNFDFIVLNSLNDAGAGFAYDTNKVRIFHKNGNMETFDLKSKDKVAEDIVNTLVKNYVTV